MVAVFQSLLIPLRGSAASSSPFLISLLGSLLKGSIRLINVNDENYSTIYNRVQTERVYDSDPAENGGPLYDDIHEGERGKTTYMSMSWKAQNMTLWPCTLLKQSWENLASLQPETGEYVLTDEAYSRLRTPHPGESHRERGHL